eukprot:CAMPEP_0119135950 /NCGR_PEP_ID=MMETSP1310-20130426/20410_1 /TAXON_ID=464262 /ORGANISM="Genus nov. species nov., Strain RCC2339" /LENGTH=125 /DNA_ID=CAMNT_0007126897 /DNA_START=93 /DNA_END=470 /DNA_ORIENTATION=-
MILKLMERMENSLEVPFSLYEAQIAKREIVSHIEALELQLYQHLIPGLTAMFSPSSQPQHPSQPSHDAMEVEGSVPNPAFTIPSDFAELIQKRLCATNEKLKDLDQKKSNIYTTTQRAKKSLCTT